MKKTNLLVACAVAGLMMGQTAMADNHTKPEEGKNGCQGKNTCKGQKKSDEKNSCASKSGKNSCKSVKKTEGANACSGANGCDGIAKKE